MAVRLVRWLASRPRARTRPLWPRLWPARCAATAGSIGRSPTCGRAAPTPTSPRPTASCASGCSPSAVQHDETFASLLAAATARDVLDADVLPVEECLARRDRAAQPGAPVLLIVIDGMSAAVAAAVADGISRLSWTEHVPSGADTRAACWRRCRP